MKKAIIALLLVFGVSANAYTPSYNATIDSSNIRAIIVLDWWGGNSGNTPIDENSLSTDDGNLILTDDGNQILMDRP